MAVGHGTPGADPGPSDGDGPVASPLVTVLMANFNGERHLRDALESALAQTVSDLEVVLVDDASTDRSLAVAAVVAARDARLRVAASPRNGGPAAARNHGLGVARGRWIAVMDSDDLMRPDRLERLIAAAERDGADIAADNLLVFDDARRAAPHPLVRNAARPAWVDPATYVRSNALFGRAPSLGYLKPVFRAATLRTQGSRYDERLRIGEDYDFVARLLASGARFRTYPETGYLYRRHAASTSHRLSRRSIEALIAADDDFRGMLNGAAAPPGLARALKHRARSLRRALAFDGLVTAIKRRDWRAALRLAARDPRAMLLLRLPLLARLGRR